MSRTIVAFPQAARHDGRSGRRPPQRAGLSRSVSLNFTLRPRDEDQQPPAGGRAAMPRGAEYVEACAAQGLRPLTRSTTMGPAAADPQPAPAPARRGSRPGLPPRSPHRGPPRGGGDADDDAPLQRTASVEPVDLARMAQRPRPPPDMALQRASSLATDMLRRTLSNSGGVALGGGGDDGEAAGVVERGRPPPGMALRRTATLDPTMMARARLRKFDKKRLSRRRAQDERDGKWLAAMESNGFLGVGARFFPQLARYSSRMPLTVKVRRNKSNCRSSRLGQRRTALEGRLERYSTGAVPLAVGGLADGDAQAAFGAATESGRDLEQRPPRFRKYQGGPVGLSAGAAKPHSQMSRYSKGAPLRYQNTGRSKAPKYAVDKSVLSKYSSVVPAQPTRAGRPAADILAKYSSRLPVEAAGRAPEVRRLEEAVERVQNDTTQPRIAPRVKPSIMAKYSTGESKLQVNA